VGQGQHDRHPGGSADGHRWRGRWLDPVRRLIDLDPLDDGANQSARFSGVSAFQQALKLERHWACAAVNPEGVRRDRWAFILEPLPAYAA